MASEAGRWLVGACVLAWGCARSSHDPGGGAGHGSSGGTTGQLVPYFHAGTRLKPMVVAVGPEVDVIDRWSESGWFDTELDIECYFVPDGNGVERCFPLALLTGGLTYADAGCTQPVLFMRGSGPCDALRFRYVVADDFGHSCAHRGFHIGTELPLATPLFVSSSGTCEPSSFPTPSDGHVWELQAVPPETFVGMQRVRQERAPGVDAVVRKGEDGSWQLVDFFDNQRGAVCRDLSPLLIPSKCIPVPAGFTGEFADAACETRAAQVMPGGTCERETPTAIMETHFVPEACPAAQTFELFEIAGARDTELFHDDDSGACVATGSSSNMYVQGAPIDVATLPTTELVEVGNGPVQGRFLGFGGVPFFPALRTGPFVAAASGESCIPFDFADGVLRCVPSSFASQLLDGIYHEGSTCDGARLLLWAAPCPGTPEPRGAVLVESTGCNEAVVTGTFTVSDESSASVVSRVNASTGACESVDPAVVNAAFFLLHESLNPAEVFPPLARLMRD